MLKIIKAEEIDLARRIPIDAKALSIAQGVVDDVRETGESALIKYAERFGEVQPGGKLVYERSELEAGLALIDEGDRMLLERTADRIREFAMAQRESLREFQVKIPGGVAGQRVTPVERAGCYAPGGRFPLPSSVLMTAVTARVAGVKDVWVASPNPAPIVIAAAAVAGADALLTAGGAQAIAAMAYGAGPVPPCDVVVGPGNKYVTAAKKIISGSVGIDMLAGPSELVVLADSDSNPSIVAADLIAQAEHDVDAIPILVALDKTVIADVDEEIAKQLGDLSTKDTAQAAFQNGFAVLARDLDEAISICDQIAPEHLELQVRNADEIGERFSHYGALFVGSLAAEVFGDYGAGPNHTLPTGGTARFAGGLSVMDFVRVRTWMRIEGGSEAKGLASDAARFGEIEGLVGHARSAKLRI